MKLKNLLLLFAILALLVGSTGCIFSPDDDEGETPPVVEELPPNTTPDILMSNFKVIYEGMNAGDYEALLHHDYRTILLQDTFDDWADSDTPLEQMYFDHDSEVQIHRNMFEGLGGVNEEGTTIPPIDSISVSVMDKEGIWAPVEDSEEYFGERGAYFARYNLLMHFYKPDGNRFEVDQTVDFFVIQGDDDMWYMLGQRGTMNR